MFNPKNINFINDLFGFLDFMSPENSRKQFRTAILKLGAIFKGAIIMCILLKIWRTSKYGKEVSICISLVYKV